MASRIEAGQLLDAGALFVAPGEDVGVDRAKAELGGIDLLADAVQPGQQLGCQRQIDIAGGIRRAELDAGGVGLVGILGDAHGGAAVAQGEEGIHRRFEAGHQPAVGVGAGVGQRQQGRAVREQPADIVAGPSGSCSHSLADRRRGCCPPLNRCWWKCMPLPASP